MSSCGTMYVFMIYLDTYNIHTYTYPYWGGSILLVQQCILLEPYRITDLIISIVIIFLGRYYLSS